MELIPDSIWGETAKRKTRSISSWEEITAELVRLYHLTIWNQIDILDIESNN